MHIPRFGLMLPPQTSLPGHMATVEMWLRNCFWYVLCGAGHFFLKALQTRQPNGKRGARESKFKKLHFKQKKVGKSQKYQFLNIDSEIQKLPCEAQLRFTFYLFSDHLCKVTEISTGQIRQDGKADGRLGERTDMRRLHISFPS